MSSGGGKTQTTTTTSEPPSWAQPYFQQALGLGSQLATQPYQAYGGNQVAGLSADQNLATDLIRKQATSSGVLDAGSGYVQNLLSGQGGFTAGRNQFAGENPYLSQMIANAQSDVVDQYQNATLPGVMSQFNAGGAFGGSAHQQALTQANKTLANQLGQISTGMRSADFDRQVGLDESFLQRQMQAAGLNQQGAMGALGAIPGLNQAGYLGGQMLSQQGGLQQGVAQSQLDADYNSYLDQRDWSANRLGLLGNILGSIQGGTSSSTGANPNYRSAGQNLLSGGLMLGGLLLSSRDAKQPQGTLAPERALAAVRGLPLDRWNYKGDDTPHVGTYAESFNTSLGLPNRPYIDTVDAIGALTGAVQALDKRTQGRRRA